MSSLIALPIRLAAPPNEETTTTPESPSPSAHDEAGPEPSRSPRVAEDERIPVSPELRIEAAAGPTNHQFWLKDAKIAEDLFTIHRSAQHLLEFTTSMIGNHDPSLGYRPIPVMSDGDVLFMTQLSNDIGRSVGGISAVRHHGMRTKKRKARDANENEVHFAKDDAQRRRRRHHRQYRGDSKDDRMSGSKRLHTSKNDKELSCYECGRTETPEWRQGPDGLLCNVCGLVYAKQRRKLKNTQN